MTTTNRFCLNRRQLLQWSAPTVTAIVLPAHAQTSTFSCGSAPVLQASAPSKCSGTPPVGEATLILSSNAAAAPIELTIQSITVTASDPSDTITLPTLPATIDDTNTLEIFWTGNATDAITCLPINTVTFDIIYDCGDGSLQETTSFDLTTILVEAL